MINKGRNISGITRGVSRKLRLHSRFIEKERRDLKEKKDGKAMAKRNNKIAWIESEHTINIQQFTQGGGCVTVRGIGVLLRKKASLIIGIKKEGNRSVISRIVVNQLLTSS